MYVSNHLLLPANLFLTLVSQSWTALLSWRRSAFAASSPEIFLSILLWCRGSSRSQTIWVLMEACCPAALCQWSRPRSHRGHSPRESVSACRYSRTPWISSNSTCSMTRLFSCKHCALTYYLFIPDLFLVEYVILPGAVLSFVGKFRRGLTEPLLRFNEQTNTVFIFSILSLSSCVFFLVRPSLFLMTWWGRCLETEPPSAPSSLWSPGGGSSTSQSQWRSLSHLDLQKAIPAATEAILHPACVCSAASQARLEITKAYFMGTSYQTVSVGLASSWVLSHLKSYCKIRCWLYVICDISHICSPVYYTQYRVNKSRVTFNWIAVGTSSLLWCQKPLVDRGKMKSWEDQRMRIIKARALYRL